MEDRQQPAAPEAPADPAAVAEAIFREIVQRYGFDNAKILHGIMHSLFARGQIIANRHDPDRGRRITDTPPEFGSTRYRRETKESGT